MNPWIKALVWTVPHNHRTAAVPVLVAGGLALAALASAYFAPPTRGEIERAFGDQWVKQTCATAGAARCRVAARAVPVDDKRLSLPAVMGKKLDLERGSEAARLVVQTNLDADVVRRAGAGEWMWPRMKSALSDATIDPSMSTDVPPAQAQPARRKRP
jgi:hypothetical protein